MKQQHNTIKQDIKILKKKLKDLDKRDDGSPRMRIQKESLIMFIEYLQSLVNESSMVKRK
jgi:hypothetical protein